MKKALIIVLVIVVAITALCIWQRNNIKAIYLFLTNDKAAVERMLEENKRALEESIKQYGEFVPRSLTTEEEAKIASGELSVEEATAMLISEAEERERAAKEAENNNETAVTDTNIGEGTEDKNEEPVVDDENSNEENKDTDSYVKSEKNEGEIIRRYTAQFYSLKAYYIGQLDQIEARARYDYSCMSKEQKKNLSKTSFLNKYMGYANEKQSECDATVNSLLSSMKEELKSIGADTAIIGVIQKAYEDEKAVRKAYYMSKLS